MSKWIGSIRHDCALRHQGRIGLGLGAAATTTQTLSVAGLRAFSIGKEATPPVDAIGPRIGARVQVKKEKKKEKKGREKKEPDKSLFLPFSRCVPSESRRCACSSVVCTCVVFYYCVPASLLLLPRAVHISTARTEGSGDYLAQLLPVYTADYSVKCAPPKRERNGQRERAVVGRNK